MNHLKTYEAFFSFYLSDLLSEKDIMKLIGVNREIIQDLLVEIEDELPNTHISINFWCVHDNNNSIASEIKIENGKAYHNMSSAPIEELKLEIRLFPNEIMVDRIEEISQNIEEDEFFNMSWYKIVMGDLDLSEEFDSLKTRLEKIGFKKIKFEKTRKLKEVRNPYQYQSKNKHPNYADIYYGLPFLKITATKKVNQNL